MNIHTGKCPKCGQIMPHIKTEGVSAQVLFGKQWHGVSYQCPHCSTVLSVEIDPIAVKADIVNELFAKLRK